MLRSIPQFLQQQNLRLLLFGGKGGVGKTTCATACALQFASRSPQKPFLLVSTDPAHSLTDSLGGMKPPGNLRVLELDAQQCLEAFRAENAHPLQEIAAAGTFLDDEDIQRFLDLSLPGLDELMAFLEITGWVESGKFACVIVDTAPSGHALRLLEIPGLLTKWLSMLDVLLAKRRYMRQVFAGSRKRDRLDWYLAAWKAKLRVMDLLLRDPLRSQFVPVTIAEPMSILETADLLHELRAHQVSVPELIVNQLRSESECEFCAAVRGQEWRQIEELRSLTKASPVALWGIDLCAQEIRGQDLLLTFWTRTWPLGDAIESPEAPFPPCRVPVESQGQRFPASVELIFFAGKGGVGKTTLACATALHLAEDYPQKRILLISTDPAHSTATCLGMKIGSSPMSIAPGLSAMEIDAGAEFASLKAQYAQDMGLFLEAAARGFDLTFDSTVLERLMDLAPPGLDEVMALTRMVDFINRGTYDLLVLDSASTGHLVRLLEMPDLIDQWLKAFFSLLLKYENILKLPGFSTRLIELSKDLKTFRRLMTEPRRAVLCAVSIPTRMALEETRDLLMSCARMGTAVPALFLNLMTPAQTDCWFCGRLQSRESAAVEAFETAFPELTLTRVYRQGKVAGIESLRQLGGALHQLQKAATHAV